MSGLRRKKEKLRNQRKGGSKRLNNNQEPDRLHVLVYTASAALFSAELSINRFTELPATSLPRMPLPLSQPPLPSPYSHNN